MIKAITFDLDGVYFINGKSNFIKNLVLMGVSEDEAKRVFLQSDEMNKKYKTGEWNDEQFWTWAISEWKLNSTPDEIIKLLIEGYEVSDEVVSTVRKVRSNGYKTLICTNNFPARINGLQERFGFLQNFDVAVLSYEIGDIKPNKKIFEELIKRSKVLPDEIFIADDYQAALDTAKALGIQTHYYTDFPEFSKTLIDLGVKLD